MEKFQDCATQQKSSLAPCFSSPVFEKIAVKDPVPVEVHEPYYMKT